MCKRALAVLFVVFTGAGMAAAATGIGAHVTAAPGPNDHNLWGLCHAYFAGSQNGQDHKHHAPPFAALEKAASDSNQSVVDYCASATPGDSGK